MKPEMNFNLNPNANGEVVMVIREGDAEKILDPKAPMKFGVLGTLHSVAEFLSKRINAGQFEQKDCSIIVDRDEISIELHFNERDEYTNGVVSGKTKLHKDFLSLGINNGTVWTPSELAMMFKMHRYWFTDIAENMRLVTELKNFVATVNNKVERSVQENGDRADIFQQTVDSNLPKSFILNIPIVRGGKPVSIEVETFAQVDGQKVGLPLISAGANEILEDVRNNEIDKELAIIREIAPEIAIFEK